MTPSPVYWGQEKFRDTNSSSVGFGKWFARIGHSSVRELPYTTRVNGNETEIVGYSYNATGTPEPVVGNDWYPVVIDSYMTAEYESLDAYIASEYGQILLSSCGVSALVPLATAIQRLAENGINITVVDVGTMIEIRNNDISSNMYGKYMAVVEVNGVRYCPFRYEIFEEGGHNYIRSWMLTTSQSGTESNPSATILYENVDASMGDGDVWEANYAENVWPTLGVVGPCTFEQALAWLNAGGASYSIVRL